MISTVSSLPLNKRCFWTPLQATTAKNSELRGPDEKLLEKNPPLLRRCCQWTPREITMGQRLIRCGRVRVLADTYEKLNWRIISKPGGATVKPPEYYTLYAHHKQATEGDNSGERPMWAEKGGIDFEGRESGMPGKHSRVWIQWRQRKLLSRHTMSSQPRLCTRIPVGKT
eukprot:jgi/Picre1/30695/NNA_006056.t1